METKYLKTLIVLLCFWVATPTFAQVWKPLAEGLQQIPVAISADADYLYFAFADSTTSTNNVKLFLISRWNGIFWQNVSTFAAGQNTVLTSIAAYKNHIYLGGFFDTVYFATATTGVIKLEGNKWVDAAKRYRNDVSPVKITNLAVFENYLYAAGDYRRIDTTRASGLARYNGTQWESLADIEAKNWAGNTYVLETHNDTLFAGGAYKNISTNTSIPLLKIKGNQIIADSASPFQSIGIIQSGTNELMAFGRNSLGEKTIFSWLNGAWQNRTQNLPNLQTAGLFSTTFFNGEFWVNGTIDIGGGETKHILRWTGTQWENLGSLDLQGIRFIKQFNNRLFVTGSFLQYQRVRLNRIAEYDNNIALITGKVYYDKNNNCQFDAGEKPLWGQVVGLFNGLYVAYTDREGVYTFFVPKGGTYPVKALTRKYWTLSGCNPAQYIFSPNGQNVVIDSADFALRIDETIEDVSVKILPNAGYRFRRGFTELYSLTYKNNGGKNITTGKIRLRLDDSLQGFIAFPPPTSINNKIAEWEYNSFASGDERTILFRGKVNSQNTSAINFTAEAVSTNDAYTQDNYDTLDQTVDNATAIGGKFIFPEPKKGDSVTVFNSLGQNDIEYLIRFENTTADTVRKVIVIDTIDLNLSLDFIQELGASHPYTTQVVNLPPQLGKGVLIWTFDDINLPPNPAKSNDFTENRGHIRFKLRLSNQIDKGILVHNKADIIYDFVAYESTNSVFCMVDKTLGTNTPKTTTAPFTVYPNPAQNQFTVQIAYEATYTLNIIDLQGKTCGTAQQFTGTTAQIDISSLSSGMYYVCVKDGEHQYFQKIIKQ